MSLTSSPTSIFDRRHRREGGGFLPTHFAYAGVADFDGIKTYGDIKPPVGHIAFCSDDQGRWFYLTGEPGKLAILKRVNTQKALKHLREFQALEAMAGFVPEKA